MGVIFDSCIWLGLANEEFSGDAVADKLGVGRDMSNVLIYCSVISLGELVFGIKNAAAPSLRDKRQMFYEAVLELQKPLTLNITPATAEIFGRLAGTLSHNGRNPRPRYNDLWIAAQAIEFDYALFTVNPDDYRYLPPELKLITL